MTTDALLRQYPILNDRYQLIERIGSGGMAAVYKGQDLGLGRFVAIKVLHRSLTDDETFLTRFEKEAHSAANLSHPNIVTVHDIRQHEDLHYIVMEYVEGQTLKQIIRDHNAQGFLLPISRALDFAIQICAGIGYAHRAQIVHCDVKPHNMLVARDDRLKVTDFGIARAMSEATTSAAEMVWGTPQYFSPEQATGDPPTPASDVYSIGVIMYEMLTGQLPFQAENHTALALKHVHDEPPAIEMYNPAVPPPLAEIVHKVLAKEPSARYRTAGQLGHVLATYRRRALVTTGAIPPLDDSVGAPLAPALEDADPEATAIYVRPDALTESAVEQDWPLIAVGIVALISVLGLVPLWIAVAVRWGVL